MVNVDRIEDERLLQQKTVGEAIEEGAGTYRGNIHE
jgi:hypothetical protein